MERLKAYPVNRVDTPRPLSENMLTIVTDRLTQLHEAFATESQSGAKKVRYDASNV
jgi:hypothetical protein